MSRGRGEGAQPDRGEEGGRTAIGYLSVPLSPAGGGSYTMNADAAGKIAESVERRFGTIIG